VSKGVDNQYVFPARYVGRGTLVFSAFKKRRDRGPDFRRNNCCFLKAKMLHPLQRLEKWPYSHELSAFGERAGQLSNVRKGKNNLVVPITDVSLEVLRCDGATVLHNVNKIARVEKDSHRGRNVVQCAEL